MTTYTSSEDKGQFVIEQLKYADILYAHVGFAMYTVLFFSA